MVTQNSAAKRLTNVCFVAFAIFVLWGAVSLTRVPLDVTSYWGVGLGFSLALLFALSLLMRAYGASRGFLAAVCIFLVVGCALLLNSYRGWPFGAITYHDILGWRVWRIPWPIPVFWTFVTGMALLVMRPKDVTGDPKSIFTWSFDTALVTMLFSLLVEPLVTATQVGTWSVIGPVLGVPITAFLGWFVCAFVAAFTAILAAKLWSAENLNKPLVLPAGLMLLAILFLAAATSLHLALIQILSVIMAVVWLAAIFKLWSRRRPLEGG